MKTALTALGVAIYILVGILQLLAIISGLEYWLGLKLHWAVWVFGLPFFLAFAELPIIGTVAGIIGAVHGWNWTYPWAIAFFMWPYAIVAVGLLVAVAIDAIQKKRHRVAVGPP